MKCPYYIKVQCGTRDLYLCQFCNDTTVLGMKYEDIKKECDAIYGKRMDRESSLSTEDKIAWIQFLKTRSWGNRNA